MNILVKGASVLQPDYTTKVADIAITDDKIVAVGEVPAGFVADNTINGKDKFAVPGFVNTHTHASMTLLRSYADDLALMDWLNNHIWPVEAKMVEKDIRVGGLSPVLLLSSICMAHTLRVSLMLLPKLVSAVYSLVAQ